MKKFLYLDIDGVLAVGYKNLSETMWGDLEKWDPLCVSVLNDIIEKTGTEIIVSSDWKDYFNFTQLLEIFKWQGVIKPPSGCTTSLDFKTEQTLAQDRAKEIMIHIERIEPNVWVAIDDMDLSPWIYEEHFVRLPRWTEGIKQCGKAEKIIKLLNSFQHEPH